jgi:hypothetical protein
MLKTPFLHRTEANANLAPHRGAPPVYRPSVGGVVPVQRVSGMASGTGAPPVYRPSAGGMVPIQRVSGMAPGTGAPPVYRPLAGGMVPVQRVSGMAPQVGAPPVYRPSASGVVSVQSKPGSQGVPHAPTVGYQALQRKDLPGGAKMAGWDPPAAERTTGSSSVTAAGNKVIQRTLEFNWDAKLKSYQLTGRPEFTTKVLTQTFEAADDAGETYITEHSINGKSFKLPTLHRRHKMAWTFWKEVVNQILVNDDVNDLNDFLRESMLSGTYTFDAKHFKNAKLNGRHMEKVAKDFFNDPRNIWIGPGDENVGKGGGLGKLITTFGNKPNTANRTKLRAAAFDPHASENHQWDDSALEWNSDDIPMTPDSSALDTAMDTGFSYLS